MNLDDLDQSMKTFIQEVQDCVGLPTASVAALLRYFNWNKVLSYIGHQYLSCIGQCLSYILSVCVLRFITGIR